MRIRRNQIAVYWAPEGHDGFGNHLYDDPVEVAVRWEDRMDLIVNAQGQEIVSKAVIYPGQTLELEGRLFLGRLEDLSGAEKADPQLVHASEIKAVGNVPNVNGTFFLAKAWL